MDTMGFQGMDMLFLLGMLVIMYFLIFLPQRRKQQALTKMLAALKKGDKVVTLSGMHGEIVNIKGDLITLRFHDNVRIDFDKSAIAAQGPKEGAEAKSEKVLEKA
jgi:preprotein translocase subunit YajC